MARPFDEYLISLPVDAPAMEMLNDALRHFFAGADLGQAQQNRVRLVLEELVTNTLCYGQCAGTVIEIRLRRTAAELGIDYRDRGCAFDPTHDPPDDGLERPVEERPVGGLGWTLIRSLSRELRYRREPDANRIEFAMPLAD